jgi:hypothetical protein
MPINLNKELAEILGFSLYVVDEDPNDSEVTLTLDGDFTYEQLKKTVEVIEKWRIEGGQNA